LLSVDFYTTLYYFANVWSAWCASDWLGIVRSSRRGGSQAVVEAAEAAGVTGLLIINDDDGYSYTGERLKLEGVQQEAERQGRERWFV